MKEGAGADTNLKSLAGLVSELWPSLLNWWIVAVLFFGECGRKGGGSPSAPLVSLVGSIESFTLELISHHSQISNKIHSPGFGFAFIWCPIEEEEATIGH